MDGLAIAWHGDSGLRPARVRRSRHSQIRHAAQLAHKKALRKKQQEKTGLGAGDQRPYKAG